MTLISCNIPPNIRHQEEVEPTINFSDCTPSNEVRKLTQADKKALKEALSAFKENNNDRWLRLSSIKNNIKQISQEDLKNNKSFSELVPLVYMQVIGGIDEQSLEIYSGFEWLIETDTSCGSVYAGILYRSLKEQGNFNLLLKMMKKQIAESGIEISQTDQMALAIPGGNSSTLINVCEKYLPPESRVSESLLSEYENQRLSELDSLLKNPEAFQDTPETLLGIEKFMLYAVGNKKLNERITQHKDLSEAQKLIRTLSFQTSGESIFGNIHLIDNSIKKISSKLEESKIFNLFNSTACEFGKELELINHIENASLRKNLTELLGQQVQDCWEIRKSTQYVEILENALLDNQISNTSKQVIKKHLRRIKRMKKIEGRLKEKSYTKSAPLPLSALQHLMSAVSTSTSLEKIGSSCNFNESLVLKKLLTRGKEAERKKGMIDSMIRASDHYKPGDILLSDERLVRKMKNDSKLIYSEFSIFGHILNLFRLIRAFFTEDLITLQPYLTGSKTHAALLYPTTVSVVKKEPVSENDKNYSIIETASLAESENKLIYTLYRTKRTEMLHGGLYNKGFHECDDIGKEITYRPDFDSILTINGRERIQTEEKEEASSLVSSIFNKNLGLVMSKYEEEAPSYKLNLYQGFKGYFIQSSPEPFRNFVRKLFDVFFGFNSPLSKFIFSFLDHEQKLGFVPTGNVGDREMFCSEFVGAVYKKALKKTEKELKNRFGNDQKYLHRVFSSKAPAREMYPNLLEEIITRNGYFKPVTRAPIMDYFFEAATP